MRKGNFLNNLNLNHKSLVARTADMRRILKKKQVFLRPLVLPSMDDTECDKYLFLTKYKYRILFGFQKSPNTEYRIIFGIEKIQILNTKYYSVSRKSEYRI